MKDNLGSDALPDSSLTPSAPAFARRTASAGQSPEVRSRCEYCGMFLIANLDALDQWETQHRTRCTELDAELAEFR